MHVVNRHERLIPAPLSRVGALLDDLGSPSDRLWPGDRWPPMRVKGPLEVGARAGHGPVRYTVEAFEPGRMVHFRFTRPKGFDGTHTFSVEESKGGTLVRHELKMRARGWALLSWPLFFRPLHDAVIEDAFDRAAVAVGSEPVGARWSAWVRLLRRVVRPRPDATPRGGGGPAARALARGDHSSEAPRAGSPPPSTLATDRLTLRPLELSDLPTLQAHWTDPEVRRYLWDGKIVLKEQVREVIEGSEHLFREHGAGLWAIRPLGPDEAGVDVEAGDGRRTLSADLPLIGCAGFWHFGDPPELELLVSLSPDRWGRGLAREACSALLDFAFNELGWNRVQASADLPNAPSFALMKRLGMEPAGERPGEFGGIRVFRLGIRRWREGDHPRAGRINR
jgi:RimJ/RimL family protein N-acetyltransferase